DVDVRIAIRIRHVPRRAGRGERGVGIVAYEGEACRERHADRLWPRGSLDFQRSTSRTGQGESSGRRQRGRPSRITSNTVAAMTTTLLGARIGASLGLDVFGSYARGEDRFKDRASSPYASKSRSDPARLGDVGVMA